ncbi:HAMP domain-containing histidine kinase [Streptomyces sp. NA02950]|uniref:sensor histidine kinase n=1 Tax=Streptomyces sp. NA02950 TaxID=2742137 RepID=UPI001590DC6B|nr:HAMP domain-containing sensor histidine kinase [Streptomyces sp. NA02950]QKV93669.1 HAMP domain-containing histidine kinase [Streptomyces sp. NA02950]
MRLATRIALAVGAAVPVLVLASGWVLLRLVATDLHHEQDARLRRAAQAVAPDARALLRATASGRQAAQQNRERRLLGSALDMGIRLNGPGGTVAAGPRPDDSSVALPEVSGRPVTVRADDASWRALSLPVSIGQRQGRPAARGTLWLFSPDATSEAELSLVRRRVVTVALLAAPLAGALAWAAASGTVRPLRRLQRRTSGLDPRTSPARLDHRRTGIAEVDDLAATLRTVLDRYDQQAARTAEALETARSFAAAASHELRTPLMSMRTNLDILAEYPELPAADRTEVLADLGEEHERLLRLLVMLRALAHGDLVEADAFEPVDLAEVVEASAADLRRRHPEADVRVTAAPGLWAHGWEQGLRSVVDNLLTNALVHGTPDGRPARIDVALGPERAPDGPAALLTVDDRGPGIPPELREEVFQRFHRRPDSPGSGLGLTLIAQQIALHRGTVAVANRPDGRPGARLAIRLPVLADGSVAAAGGGEATLPLLRRDWYSGPGPHPGAGPQEFHKERP